MAQFRAVFFGEAEERLTGMASVLLGLDIAAPEEQALNAIFRALHSIKGGAGMFGFDEITALSHEAETLLDRVCRGELPLSGDIVDALLRTGDALKSRLARLRGEDVEAPRSGGLIERLKILSGERDECAHTGPPHADGGHGLASRDVGPGGALTDPPADAAPASS